MLCITTAYNYVAAGVLNSYDINKNTADETTGFCGGCRSNCPLSAPNCPTGMERAGWSTEEIEKAMAERAVPIKRHS